MQIITLTYDDATRTIATDGTTAGTTIDNVSTTLFVDDLPEGYTARLEFGVIVKDANRRNVHPYLDLDSDGECELTDTILGAARKDNRLPVQLVLESGSEVIASNIVVLSVRPAIDAFGGFRQSYRDIWHDAFVKAELNASDPGIIDLTDIDGEVTHIDVDISDKPVPVENLVGVVSAEHLPAVVFERMVTVADDGERFSLTTDEVQNGDTVFVMTTELMYRVVDDTKLSSEAGYQVYKALQYWGAIKGDISSQTDLQNELRKKSDISEGIEQWAIGTTYSSGAVTNVGGQLYISQHDSNTGHDPTTDENGDHWRPYNSVTVPAGAVYTAVIGDNTTTEFTLSHALNSLDVGVYMYEYSGNKATTDTLVERLNANQIKLTFAVAPTTDQYRVVVYKPGQAVNSVNGQTGDVVLTKGDLSLGNVDNTADLDKPISTAVQAALDQKQNALTFDSVPTDGSTNPVGSNGLYDALEALQTEVDTKVDAEEGKGLSSNDFTDALKAKLDSIEPSGEVNVQSDWTEDDPEEDSYIKHKPNVVTVEEGVAQWSPSVTYQSGSITNVGGTLYVSLQGANTAHDPTDSTGWWQEIETGGGSASGDTKVLIKTFTIGDGSATYFELTHSLGSLNVQVLIRESASPYATSDALVERMDANRIKVRFASAPANGEYTVVVYKLTDLTIPTDTEDLSNGAGFITKAVDDLTNYYLKSETYTKDEVDALIGAHLTFEVVSELPTEDISTTTIYLVPAAHSQTGNVKDEYIYVSGSWELIGSTEFELTIEQSSSGIEINGTALQEATSSQDGIMTSEQADKLDGIENGAQANVKPDWNAEEGDEDEILNKPVLGTAAFVDTGLSEGNVPVLNGSGKLPDEVIPAVALSEFIGQVSSKAALVTLSTAQKGDYAVVQGDATEPNNGMWILNGDYDTLTDWIKFVSYTPVTSVNGYVGDVVVTATMIGVEEGAEVNVQADWNEADPDSDAYILNKPKPTLGGFLGVVTSVDDLLTLEGETGDWAVVAGDETPENDGIYILNGDPTEADDWIHADIGSLTTKADYMVDTIEGDGSTTEFTLTHNLGTLPHVTVYDETGAITSTLTTATATTVTLTFITAPASGEDFTVVMTE